MFAINVLKYDRITKNLKLQIVISCNCLVDTYKKNHTITASSTSTVYVMSYISNTGIDVDTK